MKTVLLLLFILPVLLFAQSDSTIQKHWAYGNKVQLLVNQSSFHQWVSGGENSIAFTAIADLKANYTKGRHIWENGLYMGYGRSRISDDWQKNEDRLSINTSYNYKLKEKLQWRTQFSFLTQFAPGYATAGDTVMSSKFMSPAYVLLSTGLDYRPADYFSLYFSPFAAKWTIVADTVQIDQTRFGIATDKIARGEFGAQLTTKFKKEVAKNILMDFVLTLYSDYLNNPQNVDVYSSLTFDLKVNSWLTANLSFEYIYDNDILVPKENSDGVVYYGQGGQLKQLFGLGLTYNFAK